MFKNREDAGLQLSKKLGKYQGDSCLILAVPRGGVPVAFVVSQQLDIPLEIILVKKIGHPINKEYAIGAASLSEHFIIPHDDVSQKYVEEELARVRERLGVMNATFNGGFESMKLEGKTVIVIDDGIATGNTLQFTLKLIKKKKPSKIVIAVPVASKNSVEKLGREVDEMICLSIPDEFYGVGNFYEDFKQVSDSEVLAFLSKKRGT